VKKLIILAFASLIDPVLLISINNDRSS